MRRFGAVWKVRAGESEGVREGEGVRKSEGAFCPHYGFFRSRDSMH